MQTFTFDSRFVLIAELAAIGTFTFLFLLNSICLCVWVHECHNAHVEITGQPVGVSFSLYYVGSRDRTQACQQLLLSTEPSC